MIADFLIEELTRIALSMLAGAVLSALYDIISMFRRIFTHNTVAYSTEDLLYFILMAPVVFGFVLEINDGVFRVYIIFGMILGVLLHKNTMTRLVVNFWLKNLINTIKMKITKNKNRRRQREERKKV